MLVPAGRVYVAVELAWVIVQPETSAAEPPPPLLTVTFTAAEVVLLFAASNAFDVSACAPFDAPVVLQLHAYGEVVSVDCSAPSRKNSTRVTPTLSLAFA